MKKEITATTSGVLTKRDIMWSWFKMYLLQVQCCNYERFHNLILQRYHPHSS